MKKLVLMAQRGFNQLPEVETIPIGYTNEEMANYMDAAINGASDNNLAKLFTPFPELKFKNGDFER